MQVDQNAVRILCICISAIIIAQMLKFFIHSVKNKQIEESVLFSTGGMPSSHSALVSSLAVCTFMYYGMGIYFVISAVLALIVLHDAYGVRYEAGKHASELNKLYERVNKLDKLGEETINLKEELGHKPLEVFFGILLGVALALLGYLFLGKV